MRFARAQLTIDRTPAEVFEYLLDYSSRGEFAPGVYRDLRLARVESYGVGAGGRFRLHRKLRDRYAGSTITEAAPGRRILEQGSTGRGGRIELAAEFLLEDVGGGTRVQWTLETFTTNPADRLREFGMRGQVQRQMRRSLRNLREILEATPGAAPSVRPTVGGLDPIHFPNP